jgi:pimeloyl-ACP methyl ester carboxylesterase
MASFLRRAAMTIALIVLLLYVGAVAGLYLMQRSFIFPGAGGPPVGAPPASSLYRSQSVEVPGGVPLQIWRSDAAAKGEPVFVFFHGNGGTLQDFEELGEQFHRHGWGVVLTSYRGYSGNGGAPSEQGLMADARAILDAIGDPGGPVILWGHSLGSGVVARMASEGRCAGLVLEAPYTSIADRAAQLYPIFPARLLIKDPFDTLSVVPKITVPVLLFHSDDDMTIPVEMGRRVAATLGAHATPVFMTGLGHVPHQADLTPRVAAWLAAQHLLPQPEPVHP